MHDAIYLFGSFGSTQLPMDLESNEITKPYNYITHHQHQPTNELREIYTWIIFHSST